MEEIKVSIIVPSYKRSSEFFARAIESLLAQTYENIEIVVVDDNAKLEHADFRKELESYISKLDNKKIVYVQNLENLGGAISRNVGIENSSGEYITFLDDDDRYLPDKVINQLKYMIESQLDMSFTNIVICDNKEKVIDYRGHNKLSNFSNEALLKYHLTKQITATNTFMYTKEAISKIGGFVKVPMGQEYYLMMNSITGGLKIGYLDDNNTLLYRQGQECISNSNFKIDGENSLYDYKKSFFTKLTMRERMYVRFRHHVVLAVAYARRKSYIKFMWQAFVAGLCSPWDAIVEFFGFFRKRKTVLIEEIL